jgi:hypothetical protein
VNAVSWAEHLIEAADPQLGGHAGHAELGEVLRSLHAWQIARWPRLADAMAALDEVHTRELTVGGRKVVVQWNPGRRASTTARVDSEGLRERACFLCVHNLPVEQKGIAVGPDLVVLANPAPILPLHYTIVHRRHAEQALLPVLHSAISLAGAVGGCLTVLYNGPKCGASAPDHLHLQAVAVGEMPDEREFIFRLPGREPRAARTLVRRPDLLARCNRASFRTLLVLAGTAAAVERGLRIAVGVLEELHDTGEEPPMNLLIHAEGELVRALLYARGAHRPACYYAAEAEQCLVSPGAIDMAGLVITVRREDFERIDAELIESIYRETSLDAVQADRLEQLLEERLREGT